MKKIELNLLEIHHSHFYSFGVDFFHLIHHNLLKHSHAPASGFRNVLKRFVLLKRFIIDSNPKKNSFLVAFLVTFDVMASNFFPFSVCFIIQEGVGISVSVNHRFHSSSASVQNMVLNFRVMK